MIYTIEIEEISSIIIPIDAKSKIEAIREAERMYGNTEVIIEPEDLKIVNFREVKNI